MTVLPGCPAPFHQVEDLDTEQETTLNRWAAAVLTGQLDDVPGGVCLGCVQRILDEMTDIREVR